jgi:predicted amidohydrolase YtcJ
MSSGLNNYSQENSMKSSIIKMIISLFVLLAALSLKTHAQEVLLADTIITNAKIYTMDNKEMLSPDPGTVVEAMAIREGKILSMGTNSEILQLIKSGTRIMDMQGKVIVPGFIETHVHPESTMNSVELFSDERDAYSWAPGIHMAVMIEQQGSATLEKIKQILGENPPLKDEWIHVYLIPNEETDYPDIGSLTKSIYDNYLTMDMVTIAIPDNPATLGSGTGQSIVRQENVVVRVSLAADGKSLSQVLKAPQAARENKSAENNNLLLAGNPFEYSMFKNNVAMDLAEAEHAHMGCAWADDGPHHGHHCSHRAGLMNQKAYDLTLDAWPGFVLASNDYVSLADDSGTRGIITETFRDAWDLQMFPNRIPQTMYNLMLKEALLAYARAGISMIASSIEQGRSVGGFYKLLREEGRLPVRFGYGYEMLRSPLIYPAGPQIVNLLGAHVSSPQANPWFWPMGITDGGAGDSRRVACFDDDLPGPDMLKEREMCMTGEAYRINRILKTAISSGWRLFSMHSFGSNAFRLHSQWIDEARQDANMSMDDIRALRIGFAHGGAIGKMPDVIEIMKDFNFYVPIAPNDVAASVAQVQRYGPEGMEFLAPAKTLLEAGVNVVGEHGGDMQPDLYFNAFDLFVNRRIRDSDDPVEAGIIVMPEEAVSRATALRLYTSKAAEWLFAEDLTGSLEPGKLADFIVLEKDYFTMPKDQLLDNKVILNVVGDLIVYQDPEWQPNITNR